jgi:hypothetical protein
MTEVEIVESLKVLPLRPGDLLVVKVKQPIRSEMSLQIKQMIVKVLPPDLREAITVLVLDQTIDLGIARPDLSGVAP